MDYKTKQREAIFCYIEQQKDRYVTAAELLEYFKSGGISIGLTTIYRHLDRLVEKGVLRKYNLDGANSACYKANTPEDKFLLKCEDCGTLIHFKCHDLEHLYNHFNQEHNFAINPYKTVFYGKCDQCKQENL